MRTNAYLVLCVLTIFINLSACLQPTPRPSKIDIDEDTEWCPSWKNLICGSDGINYWNECLFNRAQNRSRGLIEIQAGTCEEPDCLECKNSTDVKEYRFCASNNKILPDYCTLKCYAEEFPHISEDFRGCNSMFPSTEEVDNARSDSMLRMMENMLQRTLKYMKMSNNSLKLDLDNFQGLLSSKNITFKAVGRQGWMKEITELKVRDGFSISAGTPGKLRYEINTGNTTIGYDKILVSSGAIRARTSLSISIKNISLELIGDVTAVGADCTRFLPSSLRILQLNNIEMITSNQLPTDFPFLQLQGFIKEKFFSNLNKGLITLVLPEMFRTGCLSWEEVGPTKCFGAFQTRYCSHELSNSSHTSAPPSASTTPAVPTTSLEFDTSTTRK